MSEPQRTTSSAHHRPEIDGLRAIAVLAVIVFHINPALLPGGFAGVDIFFVISGYLITGQMAQELSGGRFSLVEFYRRRIKRIMPAALLVIGVTMAAGLWLLLPEDMVALAKSAVWSVASMANVYFWREVDTDYFAPGSETLPLLHLWSLGVEEQFYLLWPLLLMAVWRLAGSPLRARRIALLAAALLVPLSCLLAAAWQQQAPMFVYYMLPTRAGELGLGAALALWQGRRVGVMASPRVMAMATLLGLALIAASLALLRESEPFPGWRALAPTLGAALVIAGGRRQVAAPLVWVGAVSYSAYLWHWPVLAYWRYLFGQPGWAAQALLLGVVLGLSWLSHRWVEQPARATRAPLRRVLLGHLVVPGGALVTAGVLLAFSSRLGLGWPAPEWVADLERVKMQTAPAYRVGGVCQRQRLDAADFDLSDCVLGRPDGAAPRVLLWGDSHAAHHVPLLRALAEAAGYRFRNVEIGSCPPLLGDPGAFVKADRRADCAASLALVQDELGAYPVVVLAATWSDYQHRSADFLTQVEATVAGLVDSGHRVVLLGKVPAFDDYDPRCAQKAVRLPWLDCRVADRPLPPQVAEANAALRAMAARHAGVGYYDLSAYLCPQGVCSPVNAGGGVMYYDSGHLSAAGSAALGRQILAREGVPAVLDFSQLPPP